MADYLFDGEETIATLVCGVDEAGRGPLAGPVVAAARDFEPRSSDRRAQRLKKTDGSRKRSSCRAD